MASQPPAQRPGADDLIEDRYRLIEPLGYGGSATVWRGRDERLSRAVAIKVVAHRRAGQRAWDEAHTLAQLSHPHIAAVFDYGTHRGQAYLVLELVDGPSLAQVVADHRLPWPAAVAACAQAARALAAAHARGLVHRDVTPANIILAADGIKLVDFGTSTVSGGREIDADGGLRGTPAYAAPERLVAETAEPPSDIYSLGVVLYLMLSGRLPWRATTSAAIVAAQRSTDPDQLPIVDGLPAEVAELCMRCLARDPAQRPSAAEAADLLHRAAPADALTGYAATTMGTAWATQLLRRPTGSAAPSPRRPAAWVAAVAAAAVLVWIAAWSLLDERSDDPLPVHKAVTSQSAAGPVAPPGDLVALGPTRTPAFGGFTITTVAVNHGNQGSAPDRGGQGQGQGQNQRAANRAKRGEKPAPASSAAQRPSAARSARAAR